MPGRAEKLLEQARNAKAGWQRQKIERLYKGFGFVITPGGRHDKVSHPDYPILTSALPRHKSVGIYLINQAVKMIDEMKRLKLEKEKGDE